MAQKETLYGIQSLKTFCISDFLAFFGIFWPIMTHHGPEEAEMEEKASNWQRMAQIGTIWHIMV
jgi:hypothetical protein